jgi:hypothetical protein
MTTTNDTTRPQLPAEAGSALIAAIMLMTIMIGVALAVLAYVDTETKQSGVSRNRESAFNIAEAAMNAQIFVLSQDWPGNAAKEILPCLPSTGGSRCPVHAQLQGLFPTTDTDPAMQWKTQVIDNQPPYTSFYSDDILNSPTYGWDRGGADGSTVPDGKVWVRSEATSRGRTRRMVALVRAEVQQEDIVNAALLVGRLDISNMGPKLIMDNTGGSPIEVRCRATDGMCAGHPIGSGQIKTEADLKALLDYQISPNVVYRESNTTGMSMDSVLRLRATAQANGTYYTSCPAAPVGDVVWLERLNCSYTANRTYNTPGRPGLVIVNGGTLTMGGSASFHGILYYTDTNGVDQIPSWPPVINIQGGITVYGGVLVEGNGLLEAGSSALNVKFTPYAFSRVQTIGAAGIVQNTWRELTPY